MDLYESRMTERGLADTQELGRGPVLGANTKSGLGVTPYILVGNVEINILTSVELDGRSKYTN